jgi:hypothetical protein
MVKMNHEIGRNLFTKWLKRYIYIRIFSIFYLNSQVYDEGNTLLHLLCAKGDSHVHVLAELLSMKDRNNVPYFDINQHNYRQGRNVLTISYSTPLSVDKTDGALGSHSMDCNLRIEVLAVVSLMVQISNVMLCHWASSSDVSLSLLSLLFNLEDEGSNVLQKVGNYLPDNTPSHLRRFESSGNAMIRVAPRGKACVTDGIIQ